MTEEQLHHLLSLKRFEHPTDMAAYSEDMVSKVHTKLLESRLTESTTSLIWERVQHWWESFSRPQLALASVAAAAVLLGVLMFGTSQRTNSNIDITQFKLGHDDLVLPTHAITSAERSIGSEARPGCAPVCAGQAKGS